MDKHDNILNNTNIKIVFIHLHDTTLVEIHEIMHIKRTMTAT